MTDLQTHDRPAGITKPVKVRAAAANLVSGNALATHLGCTRQNVARMTAEGIIEKLADGRYNQDHARLKYIAHLRSERRGSARSQADAVFAKAKTRLLNLRIMERERTTIPLDEAIAITDQIIGIVLMAMSGMPARVAGHDLQQRRKVERIVFDTRVEIADATSALADQRGEPPDEPEAA